MGYPPSLKVECKRLFVDEGRTPQDISDLHGGKPTAECVRQWAIAPDRDGKTWRDLREERADQLYEETTPATLARRLMETIQQLLADPSMDTKKADALAKYVKAFREITDPKHQVSMMYQVLSDFVVFVKEHYPDLLKTDLIEAVRDFKNELRARLSQ